MTIYQLALLFFLVANPIGNSPVIIALVKDYDFSRQRRIILRETFIALLIAVFFQFFGEYFLKLLHIQNYSLTLCGGVLLLLVAFSMIFTIPTGEIAITKQEPFIVPIATPILTGPGLMAIIMLKSTVAENNQVIILGILLAWVGIFAVMSVAPYLQKILGKRGLVALEQLMGMILSLIAMQMVVTGLLLFIKTLK